MSLILQFHGCKNRLYTIAGLDWWTGLMDSRTRALDASDAAITLVIAGVMYFTDS